MCIRDSPVTGTITTNGNTGVLSASDILSWDLSTTPNIHFPSDVNDGNSAVSVTGGVLNATPSQLTFDFSSNSPGALIFASPSTFPSTFFSSPCCTDVMAVEFCDADTPCVNQNNDQTFSTVQLTQIAPGCCGGSNDVGESGVQVIGVNDSLPEPGTLALFSTAFGTLLLVARRRGARLAGFNSRCSSGRFR